MEYVSKIPFDYSAINRVDLGIAQTLTYDLYRTF